jgi:hypothetical protein
MPSIRSNRTKKLLAVAGAAVLTATLGAGSAVAADAAAAKSGAPRCATSNLKVSLSSGGQAGSQDGMNHVGVFLRFENTGSGTCTLYGYPGLGLENAKHHALKTKAIWGSTYFLADPGKHTVTLGHGKSAWADMAWTHVGEKMVNANYLEVTPPGAKTHRTVTFKQPVDGGTLHVTALSAKIPKIG